MFALKSCYSLAIDTTEFVPDQQCVHKPSRSSNTPNNNMNTNNDNDNLWSAALCPRGGTRRVLYK